MKDILLLHDDQSLDGSVIHLLFAHLRLALGDLDKLAVASHSSSALTVATEAKQPFRVVMSRYALPASH